MHIFSSNTDYITPSRTLETITYKGFDKVLYIYNYEGIYFRLFIELLELIEFFKTGKEPKYHFTDERELDLFLEEYLKDFNMSVLY